MSFTIVPGVGPAFIGRIDTTVDALRIVRAAIDGVIPRTSRRLTGSERRQLVQSGAVFVFSVIESGIKRWTDGKLWSPSRIRGNFLIYKELEKIGAAMSLQTSDDGERYEDAYEERGTELASMPSADGLRLAFKMSGLIKKTITISMKDLDFHLISYYQANDVDAGILGTPKERRDLMALHLTPRDFRLEKLRSQPRIEQGADGRAMIVDETEELGSRESKAGDSQRRRHSSPAVPGASDLPIARIVAVPHALGTPAYDSTQERRAELERRTTSLSHHDTFNDSSSGSLALPPLVYPAHNRNHPLRIADHRHIRTERLDPQSTAFSPSPDSEDSVCWNASPTRHSEYITSSSPTQLEQHYLHMQLPPLRQEIARQDRRGEETLMGPGRATSSDGFAFGAMGTHPEFFNDSRTTGWHTESEMPSRTWYPYDSSRNIKENSPADHSVYDRYDDERPSPSVREPESALASTYHDSPGGRGFESLPDPTTSVHQTHPSHIGTPYDRHDTSSDGSRRRSFSSRHDYAPPNGYYR